MERVRGGLLRGRGASLPWRSARHRARGVAAPLREGRAPPVEARAPPSTKRGLPPGGTRASRGGVRASDGGACSSMGGTRSSAGGTPSTSGRDAMQQERNASLRRLRRVRFRDERKLGVRRMRPSSGGPRLGHTRPWRPRLPRLVRQVLDFTEAPRMFRALSSPGACTRGARLRLSGAIAQLGERCVRNAEVRGSIPRCSTRFHRENCPF